MDPISYPSQKPKTSVVTIIAAFVLALIVAYVLSLSFKHNSNPISRPITHDNVAVQKIDLTKATGNARIPAGLPQDIPLDTATLTESYTMDYKDMGVTQSSVSYTSTKSLADLYKTYTDYLTKNKYSIKGGASTNTVKSLYGFTEKADLSIVLSTQNKQSLVQISYVARQ